MGRIIAIILEMWQEKKLKEAKADNVYYIHIYKNFTLIPDLIVVDLFLPKNKQI